MFNDLYGSDHSNMKRLILLRHAKSSWDDSGLADFQRPLNARGRRVAPMMGQYMYAHQIHADVVLASTAVRVRQTLGELQPKWKCAAEVLWEKSLYLASLQTLESYVVGLHDNWSSALVVGHNPGLSELAGKLAAQEIYLPTCAVAIFDFHVESWPLTLSTGSGKCIAVWKPKELFPDD